MTENASARFAKSGMIACIFSVVCVGVDSARADHVSCLCSEAFLPVFSELIPVFERQSGHHVSMSYANVGSNFDRFRKGQPADLVMVSPRQWDLLKSENRIEPKVDDVIGRIGIGAFVRKGAPRPDISSVGAFKRALGNVRAFAVRDPRHGSPVGTYMLDLFERLQIAGDLRPKMRLTEDRPYATVLKGDADLGFSTMTEIRAFPDVDLVGGLPAEIQNYIVFKAAAPLDAPHPATTRAFLDFLHTPTSVEVLKAKGAEPG